MWKVIKSLVIRTSPVPHSNHGVQDQSLKKKPDNMFNYFLYNLKNKEKNEHSHKPCAHSTQCVKDKLSKYNISEKITKKLHNFCAHNTSCVKKYVWKKGKMNKKLYKNYDQSTLCTLAPLEPLATLANFAKTKKMR